MYLDRNIFSLEGASQNCISNLKAPLILREHEKYKKVELVAFLALVIRHCKNWFLTVHWNRYQKYKIIWYYNLGIPSEIFHDKNSRIKSLFQELICRSVMVESQMQKVFFKDEIDKVVSQPLNEPIKNTLCKTIPEIQAQLIGHVESDAYDPLQNRFMLIDIGGGTADTAIVTLTEDEDGAKIYNCMSSVVVPLGVEILHRERIEWIKQSLLRCKVLNKELTHDIDQSLEFSSPNYYPGSERDYLMLPISHKLDQTAKLSLLTTYFIMRSSNNFIIIQSMTRNCVIAKPLMQERDNFNSSIVVVAAITEFLINWVTKLIIMSLERPYQCRKILMRQTSARGVP